MALRALRRSWGGCIKYLGGQGSNVFDPTAMEMGYGLKAMRKSWAELPRTR